MIKNHSQLYWRKEMKACVNCQLEFDDKYLFCDKCGVKLQEMLLFCHCLV